VILDLVGFMSHNASQVELPARGVVLVTGPNGSGKSAFIEGISTALWGKTLRGARWSPWRFEESGHVELRDAGLVVTRIWNGKTKKLEWSHTNDGGVTFDTNTKSQESLDSVVGSHEVWRRTCVFSASDAAHFTLASDSERKGLLEQLLGLGWFDRALDACRADLRVARGSKGATERDLEMCGARAASLEENIVTLETLLAETPPPPDAGLRRVELAKVEGHRSEVDDELADLRRERDLLLAEDGAARQKVAAAEARLLRLADDACHTCGQAIGKKLRQTLHDEVVSAQQTAEDTRVSNATRLDEIQSSTEELIEERDGLSSIADSIRTGLNNGTAARAAYARIEAPLKAQRVERETLDGKLHLLEQKRATVTLDVVELEACEGILGVRGARAHVLGQTLASIEARTNAWLRKLASTITINLRSYTEKKSGGTIDAISLTLVGAGGDSGYLGASAGERRRVDVALLLALAELASGTNTGAQWVSPIFFDEVFDSLDADGRDAVSDLVADLAKDRCVVLITHDEHVASCAADLRIHVDRGEVS